MRTFQEKQRISLGMIAKPINAMQVDERIKQMKGSSSQRLRNKTSNAGAQYQSYKGYLLHDMLKDPEKKNDTKILGNILSGTVN